MRTRKFIANCSCVTELVTPRRKILTNTLIHHELSTFGRIIELKEKGNKIITFTFTTSSTMLASNMLNACYLDWNKKIINHRGKCEKTNR